MVYRILDMYNHLYLMSVFKKRFNANSNLPDKCHLKNYYLDIVIRSSAVLTITQICFDEI